MISTATTDPATLDDWKRHAAEIAPREGIYIDGAFRNAESGETFDSVNPATGEVLAAVASAQSADVDAAVVSARGAFDAGDWSRSSIGDRKRVLLRLAELINELVTTGEVVVRHLAGVEQLLVVYPYVVEGGFTVVARSPDTTGSRGSLSLSASIRRGASRRMIWACRARVAVATTTGASPSSATSCSREVNRPCNGAASGRWLHTSSTSRTPGTKTRVRAGCPAFSRT